jgi:hypothetical protein
MSNLVHVSCGSNHPGEAINVFQMRVYQSERGFTLYRYDCDGMTKLKVYKNLDSAIRAAKETQGIK